MQTRFLACVRAHVRACGHGNIESVRDIIPFQVVPSAFAAEWAEQCDQWGRKTLAALEATARMLAVGSVDSMGRFEILTSALSRCPSACLRATRGCSVRRAFIQ